MLIRASFACFAFAISQLASAAPAGAAEAFLCDKNRVVYVEAADLETMKRTDACIASYFGIKLETPAQTPPADDKQAPLALKTLTETGSAERFVPGQHDIRRVASLEVQRGPRQAPLAAPDTDFRNVKVLNPSEGDGWYRHAN